MSTNGAPTGNGMEHPPEPAHQAAMAHQRAHPPAHPAAPAHPPEPQRHRRTKRHRRTHRSTQRHRRSHRPRQSQWNTSHVRERSASGTAHVRGQRPTGGNRPAGGGYRPTGTGRRSATGGCRSAGGGYRSTRGCRCARGCRRCGAARRPLHARVAATRYQRGGCRDGAQRNSGSAQPSAGNYSDVEPIGDRHQPQLLFSHWCSRTTYPYRSRLLTTESIGSRAGVEHEPRRTAPFPNGDFWRCLPVGAARRALPQQPPATWTNVPGHPRMHRIDFPS